VNSGPTTAKKLAVTQNADPALLGMCSILCGLILGVTKTSQNVFYELWHPTDTWRSVVPNYMHQVHYRMK
jgi:hypothetical protein